jgi:hypothetical protein
MCPGTSLRGVQQFGGHNYYFSWLDDDDDVIYTRWDWFNARNYCRHDMQVKTDHVC